MMRQIPLCVRTTGVHDLALVGEARIPIPGPGRKSESTASRFYCEGGRDHTLENAPSHRMGRDD